MRCPLPLCPAPTLFVGKRKRSGQLHCIACWRQFPPGAAWFSNSQLAVQVPPPKRWLRRYSQHQRRRGPAPALVPQDACSSIKGPMRPGRRPWVGADNNDMNPQSISLDSDDDEDVNSTGRSRLTGSDEESAGADTRASSLAPEYSQVQSDMGWDDDTASSSSTGNIVSEPQVEDAAHVTCDCPKWRLRRMESSLVIKLEKIACRQGCAIGGRHKRVPETNNLEAVGTKRRKLVAKESKQAPGAAALQGTGALQARKLEPECARTWDSVWKAHEHCNKLGESARTRSYLWWKAHEEGCARTRGYLWWKALKQCNNVNLKLER